MRYPEKNLTISSICFRVKPARAADLLRVPPGARPIRQGMSEGVT